MPLLDILRRNRRVECKNHSFENKSSLRCMLCGGPKCTKCGPSAFLEQERPAIDRLHSSWLSDSIMAMQRPHESLFSEANLIEQFRRNRITAVFNLTQPGEHPYCGCGNLECSGFPYNPEQFMTAGINYFNYNWEDMTVPPMSLMMDIVHVAVNEIWNGGRIAVHCHAGFGRTGTAVACILLALDSLDATEVIDIVRVRRPGSIQTKKQRDFIFKFEAYYRKVISVFPVSNKFVLPSKTFAESVRDQFYALSFDEVSDNRLKRYGKVVSVSLRVFREIWLPFQHGSTPSTRVLDHLTKAILGLETVSDDVEDDAVGLRYDPQLTEIFPEFFSSTIEAMNLNNYGVIFEIVDLMKRKDIYAGEVIGLLSSTPTFPVDLSIIVPHVISNFLFYWFETRSEPLFDEELITQLRHIWLATEDNSIMGIAKLAEEGGLFHDTPASTSKKSTKKSREDVSFSDHGTDFSRSSLFSRSTSLALMPYSIMRPGPGAQQQDDSSVTGKTVQLRSPINRQKSFTLTQKNKVTFEFIRNHFQQNVSKSKLVHIDALVEILRCCTRGSEPKKDFMESSKKLDSNRTIKLKDALAIRLAIAATKASSKYPTLLVNQCVSLSLLRAFSGLMTDGGYELLVQTSISMPCSDFDESIMNDLVVVWKTLRSLAQHDWEHQMSSCVITTKAHDLTKFPSIGSKGNNMLR